MLRYKKIEISDISEMTEMYIGAFNGSPWNDEWTRETVEKRLHQMICVEDFYGLCAYQDQELCGLILGCMEQYYDGIMFNIREFCVKKGIGGGGIGTKIYQRFEEDLKGLGVKKIMLYTMGGEYTQHFYRKLGFDESDNLVVMGKTL